MQTLEDWLMHVFIDRFCAAVLDSKISLTKKITFLIGNKDLPKGSLFFTV